MDERFSARARAVLLHSREEAARLGHDAIGAEHLVLGVLREGGPPVRILRALGVNTQQLRHAVEKAAPPAIDEPSELLHSEFGLTAEAEDALKLTRREAEAAPAIEAEHVLLGLLGSANVVADLLRDEFGVAVEAVRSEVARLHGTEAEPEPESPQAAEAVRARAAAAARRLSIVFDEDTSTEEVADLLLALSALYRALGGDGLVILDSGVPAWDPEGEEPC
ncbi:MAG: Clp protease N-terminal domain-containing protein [Rhodothermales bacterium]